MDPRHQLTVPFSEILFVEGCGLMSDFDEGVILRAHRFRDELAGYRLERGHYMDGEDDRADRWYVVPASQKASTGTDRSGPGFGTIGEAAVEAERLAGERPPRTSKRADPGSRGCL